MATSGTWRYLKKTCSICHRPYSVSAATLAKCSRTGNHWVCSNGHPQFPKVPAAQPKIKRLLNRLIKREAGFQEEIELLRSENRNLTKMRDLLLDQLAKKHAPPAPPSRQVREAKKRAEDAELRAEKAEGRLAEVRQQALLDVEAARQAAHKADASLVFADLEIGSCPSRGCTYKFESLDELLQHARVAHRSTAVARK